MTKEMYAKYKALGLCPKCGGKLPEHTKHTICDDCRAARRKLWFKRKEDKHMTPEERKPKIKAKIVTIDMMAKEAHERGVSYGKVQSEETIERIRTRDRQNIRSRRWGKGVFDNG